MSLSELAILSSGAAVGACAGSLSVYFYTRRSNRKKGRNTEQGIKRIDLDRGATERLVPKTELEKSRRELRGLLFEKGLASTALTRLYEAEAKHEITGEEREILSVKYREEIKALNEKINKIDSFIEVGDLETLREQLLELVSQKIESIEKRIERARVSSEPPLSEITRPAPKKFEEIEIKNEEAIAPVPTISDLIVSSEPKQEVVEEKNSKSKPSSAKSTDPEVDQLQKELMEALDKLQKLDIEN